MAKTTRELTKPFLDNCKADATKSVTYYDTLARGLQYVPSRKTKGQGAFYYRYQISGVRKKLRVGGYPGTSIKQARKAARDARESVAAGMDPAAERRAKKAQAAADALPETYGEVVEDFVSKYHKAERQNVHWREPRRVLLKEGKAWLKRPVASIAKRDILHVLDGIMERGKPYQANRTFAAMRTFFRWCLRRDIIELDPMAALVRPFANERPRERVFSDDEVRAIWRAADQLLQSQGAFIKIALLTGKRRSALAAMRHDEIVDGTWKPRGNGARNKRTHVTPLPALAQRVVAGLPKIERNPYVFVGHRHGKPINPTTDLMNKVRKLTGIKDYQLHAHRHTVETRLAALGVQPHIRDLVLDHVPQRGAGAGYDHYSYAQEMRDAMEVWAGEVERIVGHEGVAVLR